MLSYFKTEFIRYYPFKVKPKNLENGDRGKIADSGNFVAREKRARKGINHQTGEETHITTRRVLTLSLCRFRAMSYSAHGMFTTALQPTPRGHPALPSGADAEGVRGGGRNSGSSRCNYLSGTHRICTSANKSYKKPLSIDRCIPDYLEDRLIIMFYGMNLYIVAIIKQKIMLGYQFIMYFH